MEVLFFTVIIVGLIFYGKMDARVAHLEREIRKLGGQTPELSRSAPVVPLYETIPGTEDKEGLSVPVPIPQYQYIQKQAKESGSGDPLTNTFFEWLQKDLLMKFGALFLLMGLGWFVSYAFIHEWIGPGGRITLGILAGVAVMVLGIWRIKSREHQGAIFTVLGSTMIILTVSTARVLYSYMFDKYSALGLMFLSILFVAFVSLKYRRNSLAFASLILAGLAPYLTASEASNLNEHFLYLLIVILGTLWVVYVTGWRNLTLTALIITFLTTGPYAVAGDEKLLILLWVFIFTGIFFVANIISLIRQRGGITSPTNLFTALGTALFLTIWIFNIAPEETQSLLLVAWTLVFSVGAYLVYRSTNLRSPFYVYAGTGIALFAAATTAELDGAVLTIAFTFEVAVLIIGATALHLKRSVITTLSILFFVPILLSFESMGSYAWNYGVIHVDFFNLLVLTLVLAIVGLFINEQNALRKGDDVGAGGVLVTIACVYAVVLFWLVVHALIQDEDTATTTTLIAYTIVGISTYYSGKVHGKKAFITGGASLIALVVARLLLVEVWNMELAGRIVTFLAIGILLLSTAFLSRNKQETPPNLPTQ